ncbi:MAG TPA: GTP-binding protein [Burkholderiales bacterium]|nr:GTP-binding protein [Burkholderiales bacterium]
MTPLANVPTLVVSGSLGAGKTTLISRLLDARPGRETWAVLANERGVVRITPRNGVAVAEVDGGCVCCTGQIALRVGLTRLLREARPARLFVELDAASHLPAVLENFRNPWLAPVLAIEAVIGVVDGAAFRPDAAMQERIAACGVICVRGDPAAVVRTAPGRRFIDVVAVTLGALQGVSVSEPR